MKRLMLVAALAVVALAAAPTQAQPPTAQERWDNARLRDPDPAVREEAHIRNSRIQSNRAEREANSSYRASLVSSFEARLVVTNTSAKTVRSVDWTATLTDRETGELISTYDVTTETKIAPGKAKRLKKKLQTPRARVVNAAGGRRRRAQVADLMVSVTRVTYEDGTTSETP